MTVLSIVAATGSAGAADVAVILSAKVDAYEEALRGVKEELDHRIVAVLDMKGDFDVGRRHLSKIENELKPDLILVIGIWALQLVVDEGTSLPVVHAMVLNPQNIVGAATNITGASMNVSVEQTFEVFRQLGIQRIGTVYTEAATGYLVSRAEHVASKLDLQLIARRVNTAGDAIKSLESLREEGIDALWIVPDKTVLGDKVIKKMLLFSYRQKIPLIGLSERHAKMGAVASVSFDSTEDIGRQAGELAERILAGEPAADLPSTTARAKLTVNLKAARKLDFEIPPSMVDDANQVLR